MDAEGYLERGDVYLDLVTTPITRSLILMTHLGGTQTLASLTSGAQMRTARKEMIKRR